MFLSSSPSFEGFDYSSLSCLFLFMIFLLLTWFDLTLIKQKKVCIYIRELENRTMLSFLAMFYRIFHVHGTQLGEWI